MSIAHIHEKIKVLRAKTEKREVYTCLVMALSSFSSFYLGRIAVLVAERPPVLLETVEMPMQTPPAAQSPPTDASSAPDAPGTVPSRIKKTSGKYVASKTGKKYHLPTCLGAKSIAEANRIWFDSKEEAEKAGLTPAGNCKGI